jgi:uncharacterized protein YpbB
MSSDEKTKMHEQFIKASGGTIKRVALEKRMRSHSMASHPRGVDKTSTYEKTRLLLCARETIEAIARARGMSAETITNHVDRLAKEGALTADDIAHIRFDPKQFDAVMAAAEKLGSEKLAPIYYHLKEKCSYNDIRLLMAIHAILNREQHV